MITWVHWMLHDFSTESVLFHPHIENIQGGGVTVAYFPLTVHPSVFYSSKSHILFIVTLNVHEVVPGYGRAAIKSFSRQPLLLALSKTSGNVKLQLTLETPLVEVP